MRITASCDEGVALTEQSGHAYEIDWQALLGFASIAMESVTTFR